ncbi:MAG: type II toxin-antitoxin system VapC family toxin [Gammaproteobacteria bacterium]|nr:type II toxin-antitoxin system VapC family toxin [Gammaproteobacteria bacterium]
MIFVDSNVPMYLVGAPHPNRERLEAFLRYRPDEDYVTSAEVYQEILHRFVAIDRRRAIEDAFMLLDDLVVSVFPVQRSDVDAAREIAVLQPELSARDCLHLAVMQANGVDRILTFDNGFSEQMGVTRLP